MRNGRTSSFEGFTLIELILVMTILTIAVSITAPALANFFRGRTQDSEARRLLALIRQGQSRAVSEGVPTELWIDSRNGKFGLETEPSYEPMDPKAVEFSLDSDIQIQTETINSLAGASSMNSAMFSSGASVTNSTRQLSRHPELPRIRFLPDGTISESSPNKVTLTGRDGNQIALTQSRNGLNYEISRGN
jgi:type II secretion system protein H